MLKLQLGDEIRRLKDIPNSIKIVTAKASELFGVKNPCFRYKDEDGDPITISTQEEYLEACALHSGTFKLEVLDLSVVILKRSEILISSLNSENHSYKCDSFSDTSKILINLPSELEKTPHEHSISIQTEEIPLIDQATESVAYKDASCDTDLIKDSSDSASFPVDPYKELENMLNKHFGLSQPKKIAFMGVRCFKCKADIYDVLYKCSHCQFFYLCEDCEAVDNHNHVLTKSRTKVEQISSPRFLSESLDSLTLKEPRESLTPNLEKLKKMGFTDENACINALIKNNYSLQQSVECLITGMERSL